MEIINKEKIFAGFYDKRRKQIELNNKLVIKIDIIKFKLKKNLKKTAIKIKTEKWNEIISELRKRGWIVTAKYWGFDAGIDDDFLVLRKGFKKILFGWSNWFEGEIKCNDKLFEYLETEFNIKFEFGKPISLKPIVILIYRIQSLPLFIVKKLKLLENE